jgi:FkbM family methyltransferase
MIKNLVFDIGAHKGEDTAFYLAKGFSVVAIEANPAFCNLIAERFKDAVSSRTLTILNVAISRTAGKIDFYVNEDNSVFGTTKSAWVERNRQLGQGNVKKIVVDSAPLSDIAKRFGVPRYCKIDIEGNDVEALASFTECDETPDFVSIESEKLNWSRLLDELKLFRSLGYRRFKIIDQSIIELQDCPNPPAEGSFVDYKFELGSSGLFGEELPGRWLDILEVIETYKGIFRGYSLNGDCGLFPSYTKKSVFGAMSRLQSKLFRLRGWRSYINPAYTLPNPGWYDTHAGK